MDSFPAELWIKVFEKLSHRDWVVISTACCRFRDLAQDCLYREVSVYTSRLRDGQGGNIPNFARSISERPELAALVHTLYFDDTSLLDLCPMSLFSSIRTLQLSEISLDSSLCSALLILPYLNSISSFHCKVDPSTDLNVPLVPDRAIDLSIDEPWSGDGWNVLAPGGLRSLTIDTVVPQCATSILANAMLHGQSSSLTTLRILNKVPSNIVPFLVSSPNLLRLSLSEIPRPPHDIYSLPGNAIPQLEFFSAYGENIHVVIGGRPVHTVELGLPFYTMGVPVDILLSLQTTSVPVTKLFLKGHHHQDVKYLQQAPTTLHHLRVTLPDDHRVFLSALLRLTNLQVLQVSSFNVMSNSDESDLVNAISQECPRLCEIIFKERKYVTRRWRKSTYGNWENYLVC